MQIPVDFTTVVEEFIAHKGLKMTYSKAPLRNEFFIRSHELLFDQGINDLEVSVFDWDGIPCFFGSGSKSTLPFDVFAASFYLVSRYEEYLPHVKDMHGRFPAKQSLAYRYQFLEKPLVDIWAYKLLEKIKERFPEYPYKERKYRFISTVDVDHAYAYKHKGLVRSIGGFLKDVSRFKLRNIWDRFAVLSNIRRDPYDTFDTLLRLKKKMDVPVLFFFLVADYTTFDTNVSASKNSIKILIKNIVDYASVGLHPSYFSMKKESILKKEKERLEAITNIPMDTSRQHYLRFDLPKTYQNLIDLEIKEEYSMGYASHLGFRASTCTPFYFYDLDFEIQTPLKVVPFALTDTTLNDYLKLTPKQSIGKIRDLKDQVKVVNGTFVTLFHNESLSNYLRWRGWKKVYKAMLEIGKE